MIKAEIIADSLSPQGNRLTTFEVVFPRIVLAEFNTHRMFSRNSASSRAIPFKKMVKMVEDNPFIPIAWQKDHKGMQGVEYLIGEGQLEEEWDDALGYAINQAKELNRLGVTKQLCNRLLEPFMYHRVIVTSSEEGLENFFNLRCPQYELDWFNGTHDVTERYRSKKEALSYITSSGKVHVGNGRVFNETMTDLEWLQINKSQAEIHIQALAEAMWDAYNENKPKQLKADEWHIPYGDKMGDASIEPFVKDGETLHDVKIKIAVARCARLSYQTLGDDGKFDYFKDIKLHDRLAEMEHWSPFEHVAQAMSDSEYLQFGHSTPYDSPLEDDGKYYNADYAHRDIQLSFNQGWCRNFRGFIQYRALID